LGFSQPAGSGDRHRNPRLGRTPLPAPCHIRLFLGVLGIKLERSADYHSPHNRRLLDAFVTQISLAMERVHLAEQAEQTQILQARESLERALLNSISHDLRTPLVSIIGALSSLRDENIQIDDRRRRDLLTGAWDEAERLNRFVGNLLDMTRLEAGEMGLRERTLRPSRT